MTDKTNTENVAQTHAYLWRERTDLAQDRTELAQDRTELARYRTRLSNKRTFLAWCRTALAFMTFGFLLEKIDVFVATQHLSVSDAMLRNMGNLGKFAFVTGPLLVALAGWRYYRMEKILGRTAGQLGVIPELTLFIVISVAAIIYTFF